MSGKSRESILRKLSIEQVEWQTGICRIPDEKASGSILFTGDWAPHREFFSLMVEKPRDIYGDTLEFLQRADLRILNLECAMGGDTPLVKSGPLIRGGREHLPCFRSAQADLVSLANNHFCDYGPTGVQETIALLREEGIDFCGAGSSLQEALQFVVREVNGVKVAFLSFSESGSDLPEAGAQTYGLFAWHPEMVAEQIKLARSCSDLVVVLMHAGCEHIPYPPLYVQQTARKLAEAGAEPLSGITRMFRRELNSIRACRLPTVWEIIFSRRIFLNSTPEDICCDLIFRRTELSDFRFFHIRLIPLRAFRC